jgi:type IV pilus assembly protein PilN
MRFGVAQVFTMIQINLLPHREAARKRRKELFNLLFGVSALCGCLLAGMVFLWFQNEITRQQDKNIFLQTEVKKLDEQIKDIANLESEITALRARQQSVEDLQSDRNLPVHLLTELVNQLPEGVYINKMVQQDQQVTLNGVAHSNERVSELLRNLANNTPWFSKPELVEIISSITSVASKEQKRVYNFAIRLQLMRASEAEKLNAALDKTLVSVPSPTNTSNPPLQKKP